jgi:hypothetical protein
MIKKSVEPVCNFFDDRPISESSKKLYISKLKKLNGSVPTTLDFLKNTKEMDSKLEAMGLNTRRSAVIAIVSACKGKEPELHAHYTGLMDKLNKEERETTKDTKSAKQEENWMSLDELDLLRKEKGSIVKKVSKKKEITDGQFRELQAYTLLSLYILLPPRRSLDYVAMVVGKEPDQNKEVNYYFNGHFYMNAYKTAKVYKQQIISVPKDLQNILKVYLRFKPKNSDRLLVSADGVPLTTKSVVSILNTITGKHISTSMLRNIYASSVAKPLIDKLSSLASAMGTSTDQLANTYSKN